MSVTAYCKKCKNLVPMGETCACCGQKLTKANVRVTWVQRVKPVASWCRWNSVMRLFLPVLLLVLLAITLTEAAARGWAAAAQLLRGGMLLYALGAFLLVLAGTFAVLLLQGTEEMHYLMDGKGVTARCYLPAGSHRQLFFRGLNMQAVMPLQKKTNMLDGRLMAWEKQLPYGQISRMQLWADKSMALLYHPSFWLALPLYCTPESYPDACDVLFYLLYGQPLPGNDQ